jgi:chromosome segregation ATPase
VASEVVSYSSSISSLQITTDEMKSTVESVEEEVDTVTGEVSAHTTAIAALNINTQSISASVSETQEQVKTNKENNDTAIETLTKKVDTKVSADEVNIAITTQLENGVDKVETKTGFTFNDAGLNISKSNSEISTQISENGMAVSRSGAEVLTANNTGVKAENLHATTYLVIGSNSRFEDYDGSRTGCFWIGG